MQGVRVDKCFRTEPRGPQAKKPPEEILGPEKKSVRRATTRALRGWLVLLLYGTCSSPFVADAAAADGSDGGSAGTSAVQEEEPRTTQATQVTLEEEEEEEEAAAAVAAHYYYPRWMADAEARWGRERQEQGDARHMEQADTR